LVAAFFLEFAQNIDHSPGAVNIWTRPAVKDDREIEFPETINMDRLLDQEQGSEEYRLISVARYIGSDPRIRHYMAFYVLEGQWCKFDDKSVKAVPFYAVFDENFPASTFRPQTL
jgi:hypothetical protein